MAVAQFLPPCGAPFPYIGGGGAVIGWPQHDDGGVAPLLGGVALVVTVCDPGQSCVVWAWVGSWIGDHCRRWLMLCRAHSWETPRGRYDEHINKFSLSKKPRFDH
jgi:hypothetical protein